MNLEKIKDYDISIISDPHVLAYDLIKDTEDFNKEIKIDRKLLVESEGLFKKSLSMVDDANSRFLFLPGDLVKDGEYKSHKVVANELIKWKNKNPEREIFMIPGNHDINNHRSYDFKKDTRAKNISPKEFYELYSFIYDNKYVLEMYKDTNIFLNYLDRVNKEFAREEKYSYYAHGYFSYVARIPSNSNDSTGLSIICLDTSIYSADVEQSHRDDRENVPGSINLEQMKWLVEKIEEAKKRKDLIFIMAHHALMPNFRNQELVFSPFIIKEWRSKYQDPDPRINAKTPIEVLADNGVKFVFTGHLHENGTVKYTSELGNEIYDIQTGSPITYPLPIRHIKIVNKVSEESGYEVYIKTELIKEFTYKNLAGEYESIDDAINYTIEKQLTLKEVLHNYGRVQANNPKFKNINIKDELSTYFSAKLKRPIPKEDYINEVLFPMVEDKFPMSIKHVGKIFIENIDGEYQFTIKAARNKFYIKASNIEGALNIIFDQIENKILVPYQIVYYWDKIVNISWQMPIDDDGHSLYDFLNYIYQNKPLCGEQRPIYINKMIDNLNDSDYNIVNRVIDNAGDEINEVFDKLTSSIKLEKDGSSKKFFDDLIQTKGFTSNIAYKFIKLKVKTLRDLLNFFSVFITKKRDLKGVDLAKKIVNLKSVVRAKENFSKQMFGQASLRQFVIDLVDSLSDEMVDVYQNDEINELEKYFNYIEYDDTKK